MTIKKVRYHCVEPRLIC